MVAAAAAAQQQARHSRPAAATGLLYDRVNQRIVKALTEGGPSSLPMLTRNFPSLLKVRDLEARLGRLQAAGLITRDDARGAAVYKRTRKGRDEYFEVTS